MRRYIIAIVLGISLAAPLRAQQPATKLCFSPRQLPACRSFLVTEFGAITPMSGGGYAGEAHATWEYGLMRNRGAKSAVGATALLGMSDDVARFGLKARYTRWLGRSASLDVAPGLLILGANEGVDWRRVLGFTGSVGVGTNLVGVRGQLELTRAASGAIKPATYLGMRLGGKTGAITGIALPLLLYILWSSAED